MRKSKKLLCLSMAFIMSISTLFGCGNTNTKSKVTDSETTTEAVSLDAVKLDDDVIYKSIEQAEEGSEDSTEEDSGLDTIQLNSAQMLNYITVLSTEITSSSASRVFLEETYNELINNTSPNVDEKTENELLNLLDILQGLRMNDIQRERTQYLYEQNCAQAFKAAIPNPIGLLSAVKSGNLAGVVASAAYMAIDSYSSYESYKKDVELENLKENWKLDDAESQYIHDNRSSSFKYMIEISRDNNLPDDVTLTENDVDYFVKWRNNDNVESRIQMLETAESKKKYSSFGPYWLLLAKSYYENGKYEECLSAIDEYEKLDCKIFRKDYEFAQTLPVAIAAADQTLSDNEYVDTIEHFVTEIIDNCDQDDWQLRYVAAQSCLSLYSRTENVNYLFDAYTLAKNNVNNLVSEQLSENDSYMAEPELQKESKNPVTNIKIKDANKKTVAEKNKTLPPVSQGLLLNCQLLFALADKVNLSDDEKQSINKILHPNDDRLFLTDTLEKNFWFDHEMDEEDDSLAGMTKNSITIPTKYLSENSSIEVVAVTDDGEETIKGWELSSGTREDSDDMNTFTTTYERNEKKDFDYSDVKTIKITISPDKDTDLDAKVIEFSVSKAKGIQNPLTKNYEFERVE